MGTLRFARISAQKDLRRRLADPLALATWMAVPLLLGLLVSLLSGEGAKPRAAVLVADLDGSLLTRFLAGANAPESPFELERVELEAGRARLEAGEASALVVLPEGFARALLQDEPCAIELVTNPAQRIAPEMVRSALEILVEAVFYAHRLIGDELRTIAEGVVAEGAGFDAARSAEVAARIHSRIEALSGTLLPPLLLLEPAERAGPAPEERTDFGLIFLHSLIFMALLFVAQGTSDDLWLEKEQGTLRRAHAAPGGLAPFLLGKLAATAALLAGAALVGLAILALLGGLAPALLLPALLWCSLVGAALASIFLLVQLCASSQRAGSVSTIACLFPLAMLGGSFFPFEVMPRWMVRLGSFLPNGRGLLVLRALADGRLALPELALGLLVVALPALLGFLLALRLLRARFLAA